MGRVVNGKPAEKYLKKSQALKQLQISSDNFARLCILKGIYPRVPKHPKGQGSKQFYHVRDIQSLSRDPIMAHYREQRAHSKKLRKFVGRGDWTRVEALSRNAPKLVLDHVIRERYPEFDDAIKDLDDVLNHLFVFSALYTFEGLEETELETCRKLCYEFLHYVTRTGGLSKGFLATKGIYFQATVLGHVVTWMMPYRLTLQDTKGVDLQVMGTFSEFYICLMKFVNYRLYTSQNWDYPPLFNSELDENGLGILAIEDAEAPQGLFSGLAFYVSREVPADPVMFLILGCGGKIIVDETDPQITYQVTDRLQIQNMHVDRKYIQPQWLFDCCNSSRLLEESEYGINAICPPHLSPFEIGDQGESEGTREERERVLLTLSQRKQKLWAQAVQIERSNKPS